MQDLNTYKTSFVGIGGIGCLLARYFHAGKKCFGL